MSATNHLFVTESLQIRRRITGSGGEKVKLAAIDIGSNSVHMVVVQTTASGSFEVLDRVKEMVFLGRSVFEHRRLTPTVIASGVETLAKFETLARRHQVEDIRAVATAAVREADNGEELLHQLRSRTGIRPQVISGTEEARYIYLGVRNAIDLAHRAALIIDIGGGSVEVILGDAAGMQLRTSLKLGVQRLRAQWGAGSLSKRSRRLLEAHVRDEAGPTFEQARKLGFDLVVGTSGTVVSLGRATTHRIGLQRSGGSPSFAVAPSASLDQLVSSSHLRSLADQLAAANPQERADLWGIDEKRTDTIHLGAILLKTLLGLAGTERLNVCDASVREGVVLDHIERSQADILACNIVSDIRSHSVRTLAERCGQGGAHAQRVATLALQLFDQTHRLHRLGNHARRLLEHAAMLHDIGQHIGYENHAHHAAYIIMHGDLRGFTDEERKVLALLARYHRKSRPRRGDAEYGSLSARMRRMVRVLTGILRVADGLDRSHHQVISELKCTRLGKSLRITAVAHGDAEVEMWAARRRSKLLRRVLGIEVALELATATLVEPVLQTA